ncbi:LysR substrate-binding domain-containing protein [Cupriavidus basilensis]
MELVIEESTTVDLLHAVGSSITLDAALVRFPVLGKTAAQVRLLQPTRCYWRSAPVRRWPDASSLRSPNCGETPFIVLFAGTRAHDACADDVCRSRQRGIQPPIAQEAVQVPTILALVESGLGVALVPATTATPGRRWHPARAADRIA